MMLSYCTARLAQLAQSPFLPVVASLAEFNLDQALLYSDAKAGSTLLF
jgi:hypothetical protein